MSKPLRTTRKIELVETHNIALSLDRLCEIGYGVRWKRAFYHALSMSNAGNDNVLQKIRIALELP